MTSRPILTQAAADILGLARTQLNEAVAAGVYSGFPEVVDGNRYWNRDHLMFGKVFATLLKADLQPRSAARLAGSFLDLLSKRNAKQGYWFTSLSARQKSADIKLLIGERGTVAADFVGDRHELLLPEGEPVLMRLVLDVAALSSWADAAIQEHQAALRDADRPTNGSKAGRKVN